MLRLKIRHLKGLAQSYSHQALLIKIIDSFYSLLVWHGTIRRMEVEDTDLDLWSESVQRDLERFLQPVRRM